MTTTARAAVANVTQDTQNAVVEAPNNDSETIPPVQDIAAADPNVLGYLATYNTGLLPAAVGQMAKALTSDTAAAQRATASLYYDFLREPTSDLRDLNGDDKPFTAMVSVPDTCKVKIIYGLGIGTARIGQVSPIANKFLALHGKGGVLIWTLILCRGERFELTVRHWYVNTTRVALGAIGQRTRIRCFYRNEMLRKV